MPPQFKYPPLEFIIAALDILLEIESVYKDPAGQLPPASWHTTTIPKYNYRGIRIIIRPVPRDVPGVEQWNFAFREFRRSNTFLIPKSYDMSRVYETLDRHGLTGMWLIFFLLLLCIFYDLFVFWNLRVFPFFTTARFIPRKFARTWWIFLKCFFYVDALRAQLLFCFCGERLFEMPWSSNLIHQLEISL